MLRQLIVEVLDSIASWTLLAADRVSRSGEIMKDYKQRDKKLHKRKHGHKMDKSMLRFWLELMYKRGKNGRVCD